MQPGFLPYICSNPHIKYFSLSHTLKQIITFRQNH